MGARAHHLCRRVGVNAPNGDYRHGKNPCDFGKPGQPLREPGVGLRTGRVNRPEPDVIRTACNPLLRLFHATARNPDNAIGTQKFPRLADRKIVLPQMHAISAGGNRHVHPVVHNQRDVGVCTDLLYRHRRFDHLPRRPGLLPVLDRVRAAGNRKPCQIRVRIAVLQNRIRQHVEHANCLHRPASRK